MSGGNINSNIRTNTTCFSQNGYSEEILKLAQHLPPLEVEKQQMNNGYYPPGFASQDLVAATITPQPLENVEQQVENKKGQNQEESDSLSQHPCFESPVKLDLVIHEVMEQSNEGKKTTKISKRILEESKRTLNKRRRVSTSSSNTSESIQKLAKESLEIGKLLGMTACRDMKWKQYRYTWTNKQDYGDRIVSKLNRVLVTN
ncbi:hypothetical protein Cgig2_014885 [Carnegiea gigantea]|uniref:Uncharacterized protein n=1 Tax=Carnegiea gigantea TaxID=171969 RepID=A0A9Q1GRW4_9CARY|nr:hypothetical protein Cgig2_014885 [Carnegiea gigantea]